MRIDDGHALLTVDYEPEITGDNMLIVTLSDGGGFSSIYINYQQWEQFKNEVDNFIKEKNGE